MLLLSSFSELADTTSSLFSWRVKILETVARCKCCVIMLDIGCNDLVLEMFNTFFSVLRSEPSILLFSSISTCTFFFFSMFNKFYWFSVTPIFFSSYSFLSIPPTIWQLVTLNFPNIVLNTSTLIGQFCCVQEYNLYCILGLGYL